jgi:hypothetical protein
VKRRLHRSVFVYIWLIQTLLWGLGSQNNWSTSVLALLPLGSESLTMSTADPKAYTLGRALKLDKKRRRPLMIQEPETFSRAITLHPDAAARACARQSTATTISSISHRSSGTDLLSKIGRPSILDGRLLLLVRIAVLSCQHDPTSRDSHPATLQPLPLNPWPD